MAARLQQGFFTADPCHGANAKGIFHLDLRSSESLLNRPSIRSPLVSTHPHTHTHCASSGALALIRPITGDRRGITVFYCEPGHLTADH